MQVIEIQSCFNKNFNECRNCIYAVCTREYEQKPQKLLIRSYVISYAFLKMYKGWENFLEQSFLAYALGEKSLKGKEPKRYIFPKDINHAEQLIKGFANYPNWTSIEQLTSLAENVFLNGEPFYTELRNIATVLKESDTIRNAISHNSQKSRNTFDNLIRNKYSASKVGISVSDFLISQKNSKEKPFFEEYFLLINNAANNILNFSS